MAAGNRQDPAEQKQTDKQVETSSQPDGSERDPYKGYKHVAGRPVEEGSDG